MRPSMPSIGKPPELCPTLVKRSSSTNSAPRVLWLPADPAEGVASMDRHWRELEIRRAHNPPSKFAIACALAGGAPARPRRASRFKRAWRKYVAYPLAARRQASGADLVHILDHSFAHLLRRIPPSVYKIVTVHDLAPLREPGDLTPGQLKRFRKTAEHLRQADLLLADSRYTATDVVEILGFPREKIHVLPLGVDLEEMSRPQPAPHWWAGWPAGRRVVFSVGSAIARKNLALLPTMFAAMKSMTDRPPPVLLRVGQPLDATLAAALRIELGTDGLIEHPTVSEADLAAIYQRADALIFPSLLEGFGLPVLEAMAAGCPVLCSNASSLPEVGGEGALYFSPHDAAAAAAHLVRLFDDEAFRAKRIAAGHGQAKNLSWQTHWQKLMEHYREALHAHRP